MTIDPQIVILAEVALAMLLGGAIGVERELAHKPAGFRTHILVAGVAALLVGLGNTMVVRFSLNADPQTVRSNPISIIEALITGISFICAGTIFRSRGEERVEGLTTAGSILLCSAIGISVALEQFVLSLGATLLGLVVLRGLKFVERWIDRRRAR
jgi:putative Mg2+ transporter-C (MgtC) family protein